MFYDAVNNMNQLAKLSLLMLNKALVDSVGKKCNVLCHKQEMVHKMAEQRNENKSKVQELKIQLDKFGPGWQSNPGHPVCEPSTHPQRHYSPWLYLAG